MLRIGCGGGIESKGTTKIMPHVVQFAYILGFVHRLNHGSIKAKHRYNIKLWAYDLK